MIDLVSSDAGPATFFQVHGTNRLCAVCSIQLDWWKAVKVGKAPELPAILVIEDDAAVQGVVEDALNEGGFEAALASTGEEAVTLLKGDHASYRALITDIKLLGRYDGWAVARAAREIDPVFPIVYITGYAAHDWPALGVPNSIMLQKPFAPAQLVTAISQLLNIRQTFGPATT